MGIVFSFKVSKGYGLSILGYYLSSLLLSKHGYVEFSASKKLYKTDDTH